MSDVLARILAYKREEVAQRRARRPLAEVERDARAAPPPRGFLAALRTAAETSSPALIAELKKASPSEGLIREDYDPASIAAAYERGGAACLSVLTDTPSFQGADEHLIAARAACALPALRKDFCIDPWQVAEARALGADAILVILAALDDALARSLLDAARCWGMDVLVEIHDEAEFNRALALDADVIGVNNRDLRTFETRLEITERLAPLAGPDRFVVSESGIASRGDLDRLATAGARAVLVGESLMRAGDPGEAARALLGRHPQA